MGNPNSTPQSPQKLLFICSRNKFRSLTAERLFDDIPGYQARSAGTQPGARIVVTEGHLRWADTIFFMERSHLNRTRAKFPEALHDKQLIVLNIPDDFTYMDPNLIDELKSQLSPYIQSL